jgi:hypothetical protein
MKYLNVKQVLRIHARMIEKSGGDARVRDLGMLDSAVAQPRARFGGKDLYPELVADLVAYQGSGTSYPGPTVGPLQDATFVDPGAGSGSGSDAISAFGSFAVTSDGLGHARGPGSKGILSSPRFFDVPGLAALRRVVPAPDRTIPDPAGGVDPRTATGFHPLGPSAVGSGVLGSSVVGADGEDGLIPLGHDHPAREAALTPSSSSRGAATKRIQVLGPRVSGRLLPVS